MHPWGRIPRRHGFEGKSGGRLHSRWFPAADTADTEGKKLVLWTAMDVNESRVIQIVPANSPFWEYSITSGLLIHGSKVLQSMILVFPPTVKDDAAAASQ